MPLFLTDTIKGLAVLCLFAILAFIVNQVRGKASTARLNELFQFLNEKIDNHSREDKEIMSTVTRELSALPTKESIDLQLELRDQQLAYTVQRLDSIEQKMDGLPDRLEQVVERALRNKQ